MYVLHNIICNLPNASATQVIPALWFDLGVKVPTNDMNHPLNQKQVSTILTL